MPSLAVCTRVSQFLGLLLSAELGCLHSRCRFFPLVSFFRHLRKQGGALDSRVLRTACPGYTAQPYSCHLYHQGRVAVSSYRFADLFRAWKPALVPLGPALYTPLVQGLSRIYGTAPLVTLCCLSKAARNFCWSATEYELGGLYSSPLNLPYTFSLRKACPGFTAQPPCALSLD